MEAFNSLCGVIRGPQYSFFLFEKKKFGKKKERSILFYSHYLVDLLISFFFPGNKVTIKRHRKLLRILIRKFSFVIFVRKIFFDSGGVHKSSMSK